jgi:hypothetical protein
MDGWTLGTVICAPYDQRPLVDPGPHFRWLHKSLQRRCICVGGVSLCMLRLHMLALSEGDTRTLSHTLSLTRTLTHTHSVSLSLTGD